MSPSVAITRDQMNQSGPRLACISWKRRGFAVDPGLAFLFPDPTLMLKAVLELADML